jgi:hypothetical protein
MTMNDEQLKKAQDDVINLETILEKARKIHTPSEYRALSDPILIELQQGESKIILYLSKRELTLELTDPFIKTQS